MEINRYSLETLEKLQTEKLGYLYMDNFTLAKKKRDDISKSQLEIIADILSKRCMERTATIYREILLDLKKSIAKEQYERSALLRDMKNHFYQHVLG